MLTVLPINAQLDDNEEVSDLTAVILMGLRHDGDHPGSKKDDVPKNL